ncbi:hypothetical protein CONPUDRAFT_69591 [Coniophora puteana RWD-64-598 SS2]|uniref:Uncharacterized protein n=1 Tax=Coniophora puteana (strain RWD-64-598) TaxID=741705 RepID=A0A5M3N8C7_CONPW|nr:uncharacterized protein CONPUDRAFT_69591 [Coniophora puteana RWD-64-598 SS2]EIW87364.1 hypothetical protein CONPUDRAFT_69591 [Coniophora puteana RWD-64-598 SS2]
MNARGRRSRGGRSKSTTSDRRDHSPDHGHQGWKSEDIESKLAPGAVMYTTDVARQVGAVGDDTDSSPEWDWEGHGRAMASKTEEPPISRSQRQEMGARQDDAHPAHLSTEERNDNRDVVASMVAARLRRQNQGARGEDAPGSARSSQNEAPFQLQGDDEIAEAPLAFSMFASGGSYDDSDDDGYDNDDDDNDNDNDNDNDDNNNNDNDDNDDMNPKGDPSTSANETHQLQDYWTGRADYGEPAPSPSGDADMSTIFGSTPSTPVLRRERQAEVAENVLESKHAKSPSTTYPQIQSLAVWAC